MALMIKGLHTEELIIDMDPEEEQSEPIETEPLQEEPAQDEPKPEPKAEPVKTAPKKAKPIDKGKIGALHKAGWSIADIMDEMKCSKATVYNVLKEIQEANK